LSESGEKICSINITKDPITPQVKCQCPKRNNRKQDDFCKNTFQDCVVQQQGGHIEY